MLPNWILAWTYAKSRNNIWCFRAYAYLWCNSQNDNLFHQHWKIKYWQIKKMPWKHLFCLVGVKTRRKQNNPVNCFVAEKRTPGILGYAASCGARKKPRAYANPRFFRPLHQFSLASSATGSARLHCPKQAPALLADAGFDTLSKHWFNLWKTPLMWYNCIGWLNYE